MRIAAQLAQQIAAARPAPAADPIASAINNSRTASSPLSSLSASQHLLLR
jgi:hypothetical protein